MNSVILTGRLTKEPELKTTQSNISVCSFTLAVDKQYKDENGDKQADFISCVAWRVTAELIVKYKHKGDLIGVQGKLSTRQYETENGMKYVTEVVCDQVEFLESKRTEVKEEKKEEPEQDEFYETSKKLAQEEDLPF